MREGGIRLDAVEMSAILEQMWNALEQIETAFLRASEHVTEVHPADPGAADFPGIADEFHRLQEEMTSRMENMAEVGKIYAKCEADIAEIVDRLRLPL